MSELRVLVSLREGQHPIVKVRTFRWQVNIIIGTLSALLVPGWGKQRNV